MTPYSHTYMCLLSSELNRPSELSTPNIGHMSPLPGSVLDNKFFDDRNGLLFLITIRFTCRVASVTNAVPSAFQVAPLSCSWYAITFSNKRIV